MERMNGIHCQTAARGVGTFAEDAAHSDDAAPTCEPVDSVSWG